MGFLSSPSTDTYIFRWRSTKPAPDDPDPSGPERRARFTAADIEQAGAIVRVAWLSLPAAHREVLETLGASQSQVVNGPLGLAVNGFLKSAGLSELDRATRVRTDRALAVWIPDIRLVLIDLGHAELEGLDRPTLERVIARLAWHEWGHALSLDRCSPEDVAAGRRLLELAPEGVRENIRAAQYRPKQYTHEVVAEIYAMLIGRRRRDQVGRPQWLNDEIYELVMRVTGWTP